MSFMTISPRTLPEIAWGKLKVEREESDGGKSVDPD